MDKLVQIINGCRVYDAQYQRQMYERFKGFALKVVFRYIYRYDEAEDVVTDGFVKVFTRIEKFDYDKDENAERALMGWIKRVMINTAIDALRKKSLLPEIGGIPEEVWNLTDNRNADQSSLYKDLIEVIKELPPSYRIVFNMYVIDGYPHIEIAAALGISVGTSKSSLSRARVILQKKLKVLEEMTYAASR